MLQFAKDSWITIQQFLFCHMFSFVEIIYFIVVCPQIKKLAHDNCGLFAFDVFIGVCFIGWFIVLRVNHAFMKRLPEVKFTD